MKAHNLQKIRKFDGVAIIGAGGFIGTNAAIQLSSKISNLRCLSRNCNFPLATQNLKWISGEMGDEIKLAEAIDGCDTVIHLASSSKPSSAHLDIAGDAQENIVGTLRLLDRCVVAGVKRIIFVSSGGTVYGMPSISPTPEGSQTAPITAYGIGKLAIEKYLDLYLRLYGLEYRILRISNAFGPYQTSVKQQGVIAAFIDSALRGRPLEIWGDGGVIRDYIFVNDVVDAIDRSIDHRGNERVFNIGSGIGLSLLQVIDEIEVILEFKVKRKFFPARPVDVPVNVLDCSLAAKSLGWIASTEFERGLRQTFHWMRDQLGSVE